MCYHVHSQISEAVNDGCTMVPSEDGQVALVVERETNIHKHTLESDFNATGVYWGKAA